MGMGRCRTGTCSWSFNRWRNRGVILRLRVRLSVLRLWLRLPRLRLWLRLRPGLCQLRLWLPGLWLWLWDRLLRRLQIRLSPRYPPPYLRLSSRPALLALLKSRPEHRLCCDDFRPGDDAEWRDYEFDGIGLAPPTATVPSRGRSSNGGRPRRVL